MNDLVVIACVALAVGAFVFAFIALYRDKGTKDQIEKTVAKVGDVATEAAGGKGGGPGLGDQAKAQAALAGGLVDYVKALAELSDKLSKLSQAVAAMFIGFALLGLAAGVALVDDKVPDKSTNKSQTAQR